MAATSASGASARTIAGVERDAATEERRRRTEQDHAGVDPLVAIDARHDLHDRVIKRETSRTRAASSMICGSAARRARSQTA